MFLNDEINIIEPRKLTAKERETILERAELRRENFMKQIVYLCTRCYQREIDPEKEKFCPVCNSREIEERVNYPSARETDERPTAAIFAVCLFVAVLVGIAMCFLAPSPEAGKFSNSSNSNANAIITGREKTK